MASSCNESPMDDGIMHIFVKHVNYYKEGKAASETYEFLVKPHCTIKIVKDELQRMCNFFFTDLTLIFDDKVLDDHHTLSQYNIQGGNELLLYVGSFAHIFKTKLPTGLNPSDNVNS